MPIDAQNEASKRWILCPCWAVSMFFDDGCKLFFDAKSLIYMDSRHNVTVPMKIYLPKCLT